MPFRVLNERSGHGNVERKEGKEGKENRCPLFSPIKNKEIQPMPKIAIALIHGLGAGELRWRLEGLVWETARLKT